MAYKKKTYKKKGKKKTYSKVHRMVRYSDSVPNKSHMKLNFDKSFSYSDAAGAFFQQTFIANDVYTPDSVAGHNALGFAQMSALYNKFRVLKSKIFINFIPGSTGTATMKVVLIPSETATAFATTQRMIEQPGSKYRIIGTLNSGSSQILTKTQSIKSMIKDPSGWLDNDYVGSCVPGAPVSPPQKTYWIIGCEGITAAVSLAYVVIKITYYVEFFDPVQLSTSTI